MIHIGIKTDPINTRYSFDWLFELLQEEGIRYIQLGSFFELYMLDNDFFYELKEKAAKRDLHIKSVFTSFRELGSFFYGNKYMEQVARKNYEKLIDVAAALGADYCGSNPGAVYRDQMHLKKNGMACYLEHMKELSCLAYEKGLKALTIEPMSCIAEPPTTPEEIDEMLGFLADHHLTNPRTVPVYLCGDISHGYADSAGHIIYSNKSLFEYSIRHMVEFHFKNTDRMYKNTFGFSPEERVNGIIDLNEFKNILHKNKQCLPANEITGYLEISGPKLGRDYTDALLGQCIRESLRAIKEVFA